MNFCLNKIKKGLRQDELQVNTKMFYYPVLFSLRLIVPWQ